MSALCVGWAEVDITPQEFPVYIFGQFPARLSEGVRDPLHATALVLESGGEHAVFVSIDAIAVSTSLRDAVLARLDLPGLDSQKVILHATHTHDGPRNHEPIADVYFGRTDADFGIDIGEIPVGKYIEFASEKIAGAISEAWQHRKPGGIAYGQDYAVVGRNRRWIDHHGNATMYGLNADSAARFSHIEGYEDHSVNLLATYDASGVLTGIVVNLPCPSQETEQLFEISADFWHETRQELRARFGSNLFILPQCSAAGELTSHLIFEQDAHRRMLRLRNRTARQEIAMRIADATARVLPFLPPTIEYSPSLIHHTETLQLPINRLSDSDLDDARQNAAEADAEYQAEKQKILENPHLQSEPRWYLAFTQAYNRAGWYEGVIRRFETSQSTPTLPAKIHIVRLGDIAFATNPFEYYLDFGIQIKVKGPALQTFIVQLAGPGTYVPSRRAADGGGYGAVPASTPIGPEGGQQLADFTVAKLREFWPDDK